MFGIMEKIKSVPVHMDYKGQQLAEKVFNTTMILFGICGFVWGYYRQQFYLTVLLVLAGFGLSCVLVLPPWPWYRRNPLPWQKPRETDKSEGKKDKRKPKAN